MDWPCEAGAGSRTISIGLDMRFQKGQTIVRDDCQFPEGALVVVGRDASDNLLAHRLAGGPQFLRFYRLQSCDRLSYSGFSIGIQKDANS